MAQRPLVWICIALIGGAAVSSALALPLYPIAAAFGATWALALLLIVTKQRVPAAVAATAAAFLLGAVIYRIDSFVSELPDDLAQRVPPNRAVTATLRGTVLECDDVPGTGRMVFLLDAEGVEVEGVDTPVTGRARVTWYQPGGSIEPCERVEVTGTLRRLTGFKNPRIFDYERYMHRRGIFTTLYARGGGAVVPLGTAEVGLARFLRERIRLAGRRVMSASLRNAETRAFVSAIALGDRSLLTQEMEDWFARTGTFHILAISGLHVGLVYLIASLAMAPLPIGPKGRVAIAICAVWLYAFVTGMSVSVTRASIMLTIVLAGHYLDREGDFLTSVAVAALLMVGLEPVIIDDVGFQLSFTAVVLLCTFEPLFTERFYPPIQEKLHWIPSPVLHKLAVTVFASLVVGIGVLPVVAYHFNRVSFVFPIANLAVVPLLTFALASGLATLLVGLVWLKAALVFGLVTEALAWAIFTAVRTCSLIPGSSMRVASPPLWLLGLEALAVALLWWKGRAAGKMAVLAGIGMVMVATSFAAAPDRSIFRATFLDVGDSDACFVEFPNGKTMLVDAGFATASFDCGERLIAPYLWKKRVAAIDTLVLTHPDRDHTGGAPFIIDNFRVRQLVLPAIDAKSRQFAAIVEAAGRQDVRVKWLGAGDALAGFDGARIEVLNPPHTTVATNLSDNDASVVLRIAHGETSILLTGDAGARAFEFMRGAGRDVRGQVLKAPHHGLASGFDRAFVESVAPEFVVISGSGYRAHQRIDDRVERYAPLCSTVLDTQTSGAVIVEMNADGIDMRHVRSERGGRL
jgi:competence protein ComEC